MKNQASVETGWHLKRRRRIESFFKLLMQASATVVLLSLVLILLTILWKSLPALKLSMITRNPGSGYYLGKEG
ncbi:MAG: hypothetical protein NUW07_00380, partial [Candidatus Saccharicenans sp.]|nr:hypothetical protein [Candidatus Saccharicenans sp.]